MIIKNALEQIEILVRNFKKENKIERLLCFSAVITILNRIEDITEEEKIPNYVIYKKDLLESCEKICELEDNSEDVGQLIGKALVAIRNLKSYQCFNVDNHHI
ncbi:hypothetical protein [Pelosinus propionicus]|uniref:Uncharacterized protein n=1 Tax=Pelosinus propionicus DSM 13327 TaxID=1123291 RepID=A0A1I4L9S3_9FIRM|nr:hypothetical protein [Pelosinus propionicus]SFL87543.1 hypothetical protein SAMN04490355_102333 [Pelosinus propionicus DSM 13327]